METGRLMRRCATTLAAIAVLTLLAAGICRAGERDWQDCRGKSGDRMVAGCTRVINDKAEPVGRRATAYAARGNAYLEQRDYDRAIDDLSQAIKLSPRTKSHYLDRGSAYLDRNEPGDSNSATTDFDQAIKLDPKYAEAYYQRGHARIDSEPDEALKDFDQFIKFKPRDPDGYASRALALRQSGKPGAALADVEHALKLNPNSAFALESRAEIYQSLSRWDEAKADAERALAIEPGRAGAQDLLDWLKTAEAPQVSGQCNAGGRTPNPAYSGLKVAVDAGKARVGEPVTLTWSLPAHRSDVSKPVYLVVQLPEAVRLEGEGFYAISSASPGPYRMKFGAGQVRTVTPLHTYFGRTAGEIRILPYAAGPLDIRWAVVGIDGCGEWTAGEGQSAAIAISAGAPQLVVRDEYSDAKPDRVIAAASGPFKVLTFKEIVQVVDGATGSVILQRQGTEPLFSPTGRFLTIKTPVAETFEVFDIVAGRAIGRYVVNAMFWSHGDSFLYLDGAHSGWLQVVRTLHGKRSEPLKALKTEGHDNDFDDSKPRPRPPDDFDVGEGGGGTFGLANEAWALELSLERGLLAARNSGRENLDDDGAPIEQDMSVVGEPMVKLFDLGHASDEMTFEYSRTASVIHDLFFGPSLRYSGWNANGPLSLDRVDRGDAFSVSEIVSRIRPVIVPTGIVQEAVRPGTAHIASLVPARRRGMVSFNESDSGYQSASRLVGARLNHLPHRALAAYRGNVNKAGALRIQREIAPLYRPEIATFPNRGTNVTYATEPFPDPAPAQRPDEPALIELATEGRDLWRWTIGDSTYWLTQTVGSGRLAHIFHFSLLSATRAGRVQHADLIAAANKSENERTGADPKAEPFELFEFGDVRTELGEAFKAFSIAGISGERYLTLMSQPVARLIVFDLAEWQIACGIAEPINGTAAVAVVMHADGRHVTQTNRDGSIHVYSCRSGEEVLTGAYVDDELVVMDRNGYFDGSDDAAGYVELTIPGIRGRHLLSQFVGKLRRPGIGADILAGQAPAEGPRFAAPPSLRLTGPDPRLEAFSQTDLAQVQIFADGRVIERHAAQGRSFSLAISPADLTRYRTLSAIAVDKDGLASAPVSLKGRATGKDVRGRLFTMSVGVDKYPNIARADLRFAAADAARLAKAFGAASSIYARAEPIVLRDAQADQAAILAALDRLIAEAGPADTVVVSFAGHGLIDRNGQLRLALSATSLAQLEATSLAFDQVAERLKRSPARVVLLLDVCHAGLSDRAVVAANDDAVGRLSTEAGASIVVISASKGRQFSEESRAVNGGLFSVALERVLGRDRKGYDSDQNGAISLDELYRGIKAQVVRESAGRQTPWITRNQVFGDFDLF